MAIVRNESAFINVEKTDFLNILLNNMSDNIKSSVSIESLKKDERLISTAYPVNDAFAIIQGELVVVNEFESGKVYEPVVIYANDFVGVVEVVLDQKEFISSVTATSDVIFLRIPKEIFKKWIKENGKISYLVLQSVSKNFSINMTDAGEQIVLDSMYLLVNHIIKNSIQKQLNTPFILNESRDKTAKRTGINIRTLYRYIKKLKFMNLISLKQKRISFDFEQKQRLVEFSVSLRNK